jgi:hypothetical protein
VNLAGKQELDILFGELKGGGELFAHVFLTCCRVTVKTLNECVF